MAENEANRLRFSIEESVWLNKGQEVDEIISISLEPDISIVENRHYVSVRGSLKLIGEYRPLVSGEERDEPSIDEEPSLQNQSWRPVDELVESEDGTVQIEHRFPVDITIPLSRIDRLEDIYVVVDSFDYTLPENDCLRLEADISISGMAEEAESYGQVEEEPREEFETVANASDLRGYETDWDAMEDEMENHELETERVQEPFHFEAVRQPPEEDLEDTRNDPVAPRYEGPLVEMKSREAELQKPEPFYGYAEEDYKDEPEDVYYEEDRAEYEEEEEEEEVEQPTETRSRREENALYLTKMMTKEDEDFSRLKMCIIQRGESLDTIAARYELPLTQLVRVNRLESEEVEEGQILYIPVSS